VTEDVFDSVTGRWKLIPQGSRLIGSYESHVGFGQDRVQLAWTRLILPDGRSLDLDREPAADAEGFAGLSDGVDRHWRRLLGASLMSTVLSVGAQAGAGSSDSQVLQALRSGAATTANQAGQQLVGKTLEVQPSLTVRPGFELRVLVTKDLVLEPWPS
jgi:type IV secretion system protein TrbI